MMFISVEEGGLPWIQVQQTLPLPARCLLVSPYSHVDYPGPSVGLKTTRFRTHLHGIGSSIAGLDQHPCAILDQLSDVVRRERRPALPDGLVLSPDGQHLAANTVILPGSGRTVILRTKSTENRSHNRNKSRSNSVRVLESRA